MSVGPSTGEDQDIHNAPTMKTSRGRQNAEHYLWQIPNEMQTADCK